MNHTRQKALEFFAGGGLARLGLADAFDSVMANDIDPMKCRVWRQNFGVGDLIEGDIAAIDPAGVPDADLAWASFPCQDLSLAGARGGLNAARSGAFWGFWKIIEGKIRQRRAPRTLVLENVTGLLSSNGGADFAALVACLSDVGYCVGAVLLDAAHFVPQSRPRVFVIAYRGAPPAHLIETAAHPIHHSETLVRAVAALSPSTRKEWVWWRLPDLPRRNISLADILDRNPPPGVWRDQTALNKLIAQMSPAHRARLDKALAAGSFHAGAVYRRIRIENGEKVQRAEIRYDGLAGCLRTPAGGSSKQLLVISENGKARLRPLMAREAARLMGCPDSYVLPHSETDGLKVMGDGVCVPAVRWLAQNLLAPLARTYVDPALDAEPASLQI